MPYDDSIDTDTFHGWVLLFTCVMCVILSHAEPGDLYLLLKSQMFVLKGEHYVLDTQVY